ncbi:helix-turn-helix transcriptional regulator [Lysobacter zhanggongensis]|uniref:Helix-turn-helix domain-containing protein n=1 Tax=Lysobacter zhanggongensis TaxID=1774951 RepID=A0ABU7YMW5_9GAMM
MTTSKSYAPSDLLDTSEVSDYAKIAVSTLANWRVSGQGPAFCRIGKRAIRYRFSEVEKFIEASTAAVAA